jgi:hypothetical protein
MTSFCSGGWSSLSGVKFKLCRVPFASWQHAAQAGCLCAAMAWHLHQGTTVTSMKDTATNKTSTTQGTGFCNTYRQFLACRALFGIAVSAHFTRGPLV